MSTVRCNPNRNAKPSCSPTERQARSRTFGWMNCTGFGFPSKVMMEDGRSQPSSLRSPRPRIGCTLLRSRAPFKAFLLDDPNEHPAGSVRAELFFSAILVLLVAGFSAFLVLG